MVKFVFCVRTGVSIHAPVGGATSAALRDSGASAVSIHAPVGGATMAVRDQGKVVRVSIHAPVGGATRRSHSLAVVDWFRSTLPWGERRGFYQVT